MGSFLLWTKKLREIMRIAQKHATNNTKNLITLLGLEDFGAGIQERPATVAFYFFAARVIIHNTHHQIKSPPVITIHALI